MQTRVCQGTRIRLLNAANHVFFVLFQYNALVCRYFMALWLSCGAFARDDFGTGIGPIDRAGGRLYVCRIVLRSAAIYRVPFSEGS
jgi:hypothetical protein